MRISLTCWPYTSANHVSEVSVKHAGVGQHIDAITQFAPEKLVYWGNTAFIAGPVIYAVACTLPKLVILTVYMRIFPQKWVRTGCYLIGAVLVATCLINVVLVIWQCSPPEYVWNKLIEHGFCRVDFETHVKWGQLPNIVVDIAILILPLICTSEGFHFVDTTTTTVTSRTSREIVRCPLCSGLILDPRLAVKKKR